jgi:hypothetical protein
MSRIAKAQGSGLHSLSTIEPDRVKSPNGRAEYRETCATLSRNAWDRQSARTRRPSSGDNMLDSCHGAGELKVVGSLAGTSCKDFPRVLAPAIVTGIQSLPDS